MPYKSTQESVAAGRKAADVYDYYAGSAVTAFPECRQLRCNTAGTYKLYFADAPTTALTMALAAGECLDWALVKATKSTDDRVDQHALHVVW